jgi:hypothetical protein
MGGACGMYVGKRGAYRSWLWDPKGKRPLGRPSCIGNDTVKSGFYRNRLGGPGLDWSDSGQGKVVGCCGRGDEH